MVICEECGGSFTKKHRGARFCNKACANANKGKKIALSHAGNHVACEVCKVAKPLNQFSYNTRGDIGSGKKTYCKRCGANARESRRRDKTWKDDAARVLYNGSKQRAKRAGLEHTITYEDIKIPDVCPVLGLPLSREDRDTWLTAPSLDRIDNTKGYTPENVVVVSRRANILKKDATPAEILALAAFYGKYAKGNP